MLSALRDLLRRGGRGGRGTAHAEPGAQPGPSPAGPPGRSRRQACALFEASRGATAALDQKRLKRELQENHTPMVRRGIAAACAVKLGAGRREQVQLEAKAARLSTPRCLKSSSLPGNISFGRLRLRTALLRRRGLEHLKRAGLVENEDPGAASSSSS